MRILFPRESVHSQSHIAASPPRQSFPNFSIIHDGKRTLRGVMFERIMFGPAIAGDRSRTPRIPCSDATRRTWGARPCSLRGSSPWLHSGMIRTILPPAHDDSDINPELD